MFAALGFIMHVRDIDGKLLVLVPTCRFLRSIRLLL